MHSSFLFRPYQHVPNILANCFLFDPPDPPLSFTKGTWGTVGGSPSSSDGHSPHRRGLTDKKHKISRTLKEKKWGPERVLHKESIKFNKTTGTRDYLQCIDDNPPSGTSPRGFAWRVQRPHTTGVTVTLPGPQEQRHCEIT